MATVAEVSERRQICLLIDTSGTMNGKWNNIFQNQISPLFNTCIHDKADYEFALVLFRGVLPYSDFLVRTHPFVKDLNQIQFRLNQLEFCGGGDMGGAITEGLATAIESLSWSSQAKKFCVLVTNSLPYPLPCTLSEGSWTGRTIDDVFGGIVNAQIALSIVSPQQRNEYREWLGKTRLANVPEETSERTGFVAWRGLKPSVTSGSGADPRYPVNVAGTSVPVGAAGYSYESTQPRPPVSKPMMGTAVPVATQHVATTAAAPRPQRSPIWTGSIVIPNKNYSCRVTAVPVGQNHNLASFKANTWPQELIFAQPAQQALAEQKARLQYPLVLLQPQDRTQLQRLLHMLSSKQIAILIDLPEQSMYLFAHKENLIGVLAPKTPAPAAPGQPVAQPMVQPVQPGRYPSQPYYSHPPG